MSLIEHLKQFLFGHPPPPAHMVEFMQAAARVGDAARKAGAADDVDDGGPFGSMAKEMRNGAHKPPARKRSKRAA